MRRLRARLNPLYFGATSKSASGQRIGDILSVLIPSISGLHLNPAALKAEEAGSLNPLYFGATSKSLDQAQKMEGAVLIPSISGLHLNPKLRSSKALRLSLNPLYFGATSKSRVCGDAQVSGVLIPSISGLHLNPGLGGPPRKITVLIPSISGLHLNHKAAEGSASVHRLNPLYFGATSKSKVVVYFGRLVRS